MANKEKKPETYNRARYLLLSRLLYSHLRMNVDFHTSKDKKFIFGLGKPVPEGALVVPFAVTDPKEWYLGWYRGKNEEGYDLIESVETHSICRFYNCGFIYLDDKDFCDNPIFHYSDREYDIIETIERRVARNNYWFRVGNLTFHEDGSIDVPIRKKFTDEFMTKTYRNLRACTIAALDKHCEECNAMANEIERQKNASEAEEKIKED